MKRNSLPRVTGTLRIKTGLAEMLKGGVIMDVIDAAQAPASSAIRACSAVVTSMITPPLSISARPRLTGKEPVTGFSLMLNRLPSRLALILVGWAPESD